MIWCVENDAATRNIEVYTLQSAGFEAKGYACADSFWEALQTENPELVLLDAVLPGVDSVELLKRIRASGLAGQIPVIMAAKSSAEYDVIRCLDSGADDCLGKPFGMMEMVSRVRAVLRRYNAQPEERVLKADAIALYPDERIVRIDGRSVDLTYKEFELLRTFLENPGEVFSREWLHEHIWGGNCRKQTRTVDIHIRTLRKKLGDCGKLIESVRYIGYRMKKVP